MVPVSLNGKMKETGDIARRVETVQDLLTLKLGIKRQPFDRMLARAGRHLPRRIAGQAQVLAQAAQRAGHPKLARQLDSAAVERASTEVIAHLQAIDVADRRKGKLLGMAGVVAFNLLVVIVVFIVWLWWRGYV